VISDLVGEQPTLTPNVERRTSNILAAAGGRDPAFAQGYGSASNRGYPSGGWKENGSPEFALPHAGEGQILCFMLDARSGSTWSCQDRFHFSIHEHRRRLLRSPDEQAVGGWMLAVTRQVVTLKAAHGSPLHHLP
jgi:hypothetical protein